MLRGITTRVTEAGRAWLKDRRERKQFVENAIAVHKAHGKEEKCVWCTLWPKAFR